MILKEILIPITDPKLKTMLISQQGYFLKQVHTNRKAKDCLQAISQIKRGESINQVLAVRLLGQIENPKITKLLYVYLKQEFQKVGLGLVNTNGLIIVSQSTDTEEH